MLQVYMKGLKKGISEAINIKKNYISMLVKYILLFA